MSFNTHSVEHLAQQFTLTNNAVLAIFKSVNGGGDQRYYDGFNALAEDAIEALREDDIAIVSFAHTDHATDTIKLIDAKLQEDHPGILSADITLFRRGEEVGTFTAGY